MDFKSLIKNARPHLKDNSINAYATSLKLLAGEETSLDFLYNTKYLLDRLEGISPPSWFAGPPRHSQSSSRSICTVPAARARNRRRTRVDV